MRDRAAIRADSAAWHNRIGTVDPSSPAHQAVYRLAADVPHLLAELEQLAGSMSIDWTVECECGRRWICENQEDAEQRAAAMKQVDGHTASVVEVRTIRRRIQPTEATRPGQQARADA